MEDNAGPVKKAIVVYHTINNKKGVLSEIRKKVHWATGWSIMKITKVEGHILKIQQILYKKWWGFGFRDTDRTRRRNEVKGFSKTLVSSLPPKCGRFILKTQRFISARRRRCAVCDFLVQLRPPHTLSWRKKSKKKISLCHFRVLMVAVKEISKCFGVKIWGFVDFMNW